MESKQKNSLQALTFQTTLSFNKPWEENIVEQAVFVKH